MAAPNYTTDLVDITTSFTDGWALITEGGGGANTLTAPETDDFIQGTQSVSRSPFSTSVRGIIFNAGATVSVQADDAVYIWWKADVAQALDTKAGGGIRLVMGSSTTAYRQYYVAGNDNYALGGWKCTPIDPSNLGSLDRNTPGSPPYQYYGVAFDVPATGPSKGFPFKIDMIRHGREISITDGDTTTPASWGLLTAHADAIARSWGIVQGTDTGASLQGLLNWGTNATPVYSRDEGRAIVFTNTEYTVSSFTGLNFNNASTDVVWDSMTFTALGTNNRGIVAFSANCAVSITNSIFSGIGTFTDGGSNTNMTGTKWIACETVRSQGGTYNRCSFLNSTVATDGAALRWEAAVDTDGLLDDAVFEKGTNAHHAIELGVSSPTTITLRGVSVTGFNIANGQNDSVIHVKRTTGTVTINLVGTSGVFSYKTDGATVVLVVDPVTLTINCQDTSGNPIQNVRVLATAAAGGDYPFQDSVTLTRVNSTVTVSHTAHGLSNGDQVVIYGANQNEYNGIQTISNVSANSYDYIVTGAPTTPATGTITSTAVLISGLTDINGNISDTRSYTSSQPIGGRARKSTSSPYYKTADIVGTVSNTSGASITIVMLSDE